MFPSWMDTSLAFNPMVRQVSTPDSTWCVPVRELGIVAIFTCLCILQQPVWGDEDETAEAQDTGESSLRVDGSLIDFSRDVWPTIQAKCIECHGPEESKNDFRMDNSETVMDYVEPGDIESSSLWTDYLVTDDTDMRMPPADHPPLTGSELATFRLWIEEGANWPDELPVSGTSETIEATAKAAIAASLPTRLWTFQGLFHPASVHFPIALLTVSSLMVFFSFFSQKTFEPVAFHCLWIGALGAILSSVTGWAYAQHEGYGAYSFDLNNSAIDRHRWLGIGTAVVALILFPIARYVRKNGDLGMRIMWLLGSLILLAAVSITGYQGGELTYGENHYQEAFDRLFPEYSEKKPDEAKSDNGLTEDPSAATDEEGVETDSADIDSGKADTLEADESVPGTAADESTEDASEEPSQADSGGEESSKPS